MAIAVPVRVELDVDKFREQIRDIVREVIREESNPVEKVAHRFEDMGREAAKTFSRGLLDTAFKGFLAFWGRR